MHGQHMRLASRLSVSCLGYSALHGCDMLPWCVRAIRGSRQRGVSTREQCVDRYKRDVLTRLRACDLECNHPALDSTSWLRVDREV